MANSSNLLEKDDLTCWIITEGIIGTQNQCVGVAETLGITPTIKQIGLRQPWKTLSPWLKFEKTCSFTSPLLPPWPDLLIASGRKSIAASRYVKKQSGGKTFTVQIQDPKTNPNQFDLVTVPFHDNLRGDNVIVTDGAPNRITPEKLEQAKEKFSPLFSPLQPPRVAVLIGGNSNTHKMTSPITCDMIDNLKKLNASLMITASRRTGEENLKLIQQELSINNNFIWNNEGENPYWGILAWADYIIVTSDSVSMLSDAATTGKPTYVIDLEGSSPKFDKFHNHFQKIGASKPFEGKLEPWHYTPLNDAEKIANFIKESWEKG